MISSILTNTFSDASDPKYQQLSVRELQNLIIEIYCIMSIYVIALLFTAYNIVVFVTLQRRYKNWLISMFYFLSVVVIIARLASYSYEIELFA